MTKIILSGALGRMGRAITELAASREDIEIVAGVDIAAGPEAFRPFPVVTSFDKLAVTAQAVVDFSNRAALADILAYCIKTGTPAVLASTGYTPEDLAALQAAAEKVPLFRSANMSLGVAVLTKLAAYAATLLGEDFDVEIVEKHHNKKLDAPSGTALHLAEAISAASAAPKEPVYDRHDRRQAREKQEIGMHAIRGGTIVGEHDCIFAGWNETITLSHSAQSREVFAAGALKAAAFIAGAGKPGLYGMDDIFTAT